MYQLLRMYRHWLCINILMGIYYVHKIKFNQVILPFLVVAVSVLRLTIFHSRKCLAVLYSLTITFTVHLFVWLHASAESNISSHNKFKPKTINCLVYTSFISLIMYLLFIRCVVSACMKYSVRTYLDKRHTASGIYNKILYFTFDFNLIFIFSNFHQLFEKFSMHLKWY